MLKAYAVALYDKVTYDLRIRIETILSPCDLRGAMFGMCCCEAGKRVIV
jgi:hypothetical protein